MLPELSDHDISNAARRHVLDELKADHRRVRQAWRQFQKLDTETDVEACQDVVLHVLDELTVHAALEEELLYPAVRDGLADAQRTLATAEQGHVERHALIDPLRTLRLDDPRFAGQFRALCQQALHHMAWEEARLFPLLEQVMIDWARLEGEIDQRREELVVAETPVSAQ